MNTFIGMLVAGLTSLLGLFALIYDKFLKPQLEMERKHIEEQSKRQIEQIRVQEQTNSELKRLNDKIGDILKDHEMQGKKINELEDKYNDHETRIRVIEKTNYKKRRVDA